LADKKTGGTAIMKKRFSKSSGIYTLVFSIISVFYILPIVIILINSFKKKAYINSEPFTFPSKGSFAGIENYINGIQKVDFLKAVMYTAFITVLSVAVIVLCTSMCAWYIERVKSKFTRAFYYLCVFSMVVPFQMVMFTLSKTADFLSLNTPLGIVPVYLGFGAGLAVFMFSGFVKNIPLEIEEAAMIDGCNPIQTYFRVVFPILKPTAVSVGILETMWIWNDFLLPYLVLDRRKYTTITIAVQNLKGNYGSIDWGAMMAVLVLSIVPIIIFYAFSQKYIIKGLLAGAVKG
jgi:raffinose/stachyose/melibiose transport system permease protein